MIQANELRIGNWYMAIHEESESYHQADADFIKDQSLYDENPDADEFSRGWNKEPVLLTPEILEKAGFERTVHQVSAAEYIDYRMEQFVLYPLSNGDIEVEFWSATERLDERNFILAVKCLHQLQNLYFALTGKELEINLTN